MSPRPPPNTAAARRFAWFPLLVPCSGFQWFVTSSTCSCYCFVFSFIPLPVFLALRPCDVRPDSSRTSSAPRVWPVSTAAIGFQKNGRYPNVHFQLHHLLGYFPTWRTAHAWRSMRSFVTSVPGLRSNPDPVKNPLLPASSTNLIAPPCTAARTAIATDGRRDQRPATRQRPETRAAATTRRDQAHVQSAWLGGHGY
jgi:hypothetical protein